MCSVYVGVPWFVDVSFVVSVDKTGAKVVADFIFGPAASVDLSNGSTSHCLDFFGSMVAVDRLIEKCWMLIDVWFGRLFLWIAVKIVSV